MPVGKTFAECLQALGVLEKKLEAQTKKQWPQNAKSLHEAIVELADSIEDESYAHGAGESLNNWVEDRAAEWVQLNSELWSAKDRLPHAPVLPRDKSTITYWIQQHILYKWYTASRNRRIKDTSGSLPGLSFHGGTTIQRQNSNSPTGSMKDIEQVQTSEGRSESHDLNGWNPYKDAEAKEHSSHSAPAPMPNRLPSLPHSKSSAIVPYNGPDFEISHANDDLSQNASSDTMAANDFRARRYAPVTFQAEMYSRITFLIGPSENRNGNMSNSYARIMGLEEAQKAETFRAGVFERLAEMGENVGSRKLVAKPDWMPMAFVVGNDHDHHYLLEALKTWGGWKVPLCIVHVSLEHEV